ncbi:hypothetical protein JCM9534A_13260 [Catenuloplanes indicus JCM 9534]
MLPPPAVVEPADHGDSKMRLSDLWRQDSSFISEDPDNALLGFLDGICENISEYNPQETNDPGSDINPVDDRQP